MLTAAARFVAADGHVTWSEFAALPAPMRELIPLVRVWNSEMQQEKMERDRKSSEWRAGRPSLRGRR
jgi:hypothetical protein